MLIFLKILSATVLYCNIKNQVCLRATSLDNEILKGTMSIKCLPSIYFAKVTRLETSIFVFLSTVCLGLHGKFEFFYSAAVCVSGFEGPGSKKNGPRIRTQT